MAPRGDTYSKFIGWLKLLLPLAALTLLSTMFLLPRVSEPVNKLPFVEGEDPGDATRQQIVAPNFAGTTDKGDRITMTADRAEPLAADMARLQAHQLDAALDLVDGSRITLRADQAVVDDADKTADLEGGVHITSSTGYVIDTERMLTSLDQIDAETLTPVSGSGPAGRFTAGKLTIAADENGENVQLLFTEGVNLIYDPKDQ
ncbi:LPS export ABC transporter periplasmic protein LptC [Salipiger thiooxidans]|uniref:LPS export ABC transporter periplasmic protein LptC n=1 Tax=Salipiger thiooxidans TaxID=282683 RepID=UPI001CD3CA9F|nr:LPS export ABC transporter periplasmic protein LptC [Salipiger thiooxidans]MCA0846496.1 LPS export ABC transporter periplasmic protein LptC [Salipiger thiooxidans]